MRAALKSLFAVAMLTTLATSLAAQTPVDQRLRTISVIGTSEIAVAPDMAMIFVGVQTQAVTAADAMKQASEATAAVIATVAASAIDAADIQTGAVQLQPRYAQTVLGNVDYSRIEGYSATNTIDVKVRDLTTLGDLLAAVVGGGANQLNGVSFGLQEPEKVQDEARSQAVAEGRRLAELYAGAAGVTLGGLYQLNENGASNYRVFEAPVVASYASSEADYSVPIAPGEITISANVGMIYEIAE